MSDRRTAHAVSLALAAMLIGVLASCQADDALTPDSDTRLTEQLTFLRPAADAPPLANPLVSFYARRGENREIFMYYRPRAGSSDSSEFMRFKVPGDALDRRPDGTAFATGDSVLITVRVVDPSRLILDFQPAGLRFSSSTPAELEIDFSESNDDLDGDGDDDADDDARERELSIWKQEAPGQPWFRQASIVEFSVEEVKAKLLGFTGYAIAY